MNNFSNRSHGNPSPLISVICLTYNHERYLRQTLDGILGQTLLSETEIIVHDDASVDTTGEILLEYANQWPVRISALIREENLRNLGISLYDVYSRYIFPEARGKYLAICEGDDYWTDPRKLEKQVEFLESHPEFSICFHHAGIQHGEIIDLEEHHGNTGFELKIRDEFTLEDLLIGNFIQNCTVVYRNLHLPYPEIFRSLLLPDWPLHLFHAQHGKIKYLRDVMAVHRVHESGIWNSLSIGEQAFHAKQTLQCFNKYLGDTMRSEKKLISGFHSYPEN